MTIRLVTYNLSGGLDVGAIGEVLAALDPDVVCAVETPSRLATRRLARRAALDVVVRTGRRRVGLAVLTGERTRVVSTDEHQLAEVPGLPRRAIAQAIVGVGTLRLAVFVVQLGLRPDVREAHADELLTILGRVQVPVVVGADLNETPTGAAAQRLTRRLVDAFATAGEGPGETYPNPEPLSRKDYVLVDPELVVVRAFVPASAPVAVASHHRPVVVELAATRQAEVPERVRPASRRPKEPAA